MSRRLTALAFAVVTLFAFALGARAADETPPANPPDRQCAAAPDLATAQAVPLDPDKETSVKFDAQTACFQPANGVKTAYAVFALPQSDSTTIVSVTSVPWAQNLIAPHVVILDASGKVSREIGRDAFMFHGSSLYSAVRAHVGERYLVVTPDAQAFGQQVQIISDNTQSSVAPVGTGYIILHWGHEGNNALFYADSGTIMVTARPVPTAK